jgi:hypothetical protein
MKKVGAQRRHARWGVGDHVDRLVSKLFGGWQKKRAIEVSFGKGGHKWLIVLLL